MCLMLFVALSSALPQLITGANIPPEPDRVGRIIIEGNDRTNSGDILDELRFCAGCLLPSKADLLDTEIRLLLKFHKRFDLADRQRPTIEIRELEFDTPWKDIVIHFPERKPKKREKR